MNQENISSHLSRAVRYDGNNAALSIIQYRSDISAQINPNFHVEMLKKALSSDTPQINNSQQQCEKN